MPRLINAETLVEYKASGVSDLTEWQKGWNDAIDTIMGEAPTVDAEPVRHGHWIHDYDLGCTTCSKCCDHYLWEDFNGTGDWNYCPNCGAKMDGERREDADK